ncbi:MAG: phosphoadenylyl-sulfate reductase [Phycisphaeraceae bacterium]
MTTQTLNPSRLDLAAANQRLADAAAPDVVQWAAQTFGSSLIMTSSFGVQAAVMLHLVTRHLPDIPVVFIDTGYLHTETYKFADELTHRLKLNLKVYQPVISAARMEALMGKLWESNDRDSLIEYDRIRKVEPMHRALRELGATAWLAGLRANQTDHRADLRRVELQDGIYKVHPILGWSSKQVHEYLKQHDLPYHPLRDQGYASIGDWHSTRPITAEEHERAGRFKGLKQECGLHLPSTQAENESRGSADL